MSRRSVQRKAWNYIYKNRRPGLEGLTCSEAVIWLLAFAFVIYLIAVN